MNRGQQRHLIAEEIYWVDEMPAKNSGHIRMQKTDASIPSLRLGPLSSENMVSPQASIELTLETLLTLVGAHGKKDSNHVFHSTINTSMDFSVRSGNVFFFFY